MKLMDKYNDSLRKVISHRFYATLLGKDKAGKTVLTWRGWRWMAIIALHLLFFLSFHIDIQILEGTLSASRILGFHLIDPFATLQVVLAERVLPTNMLIGTATIVIFYLLIGGRTYCAWVCPYGLLSEIGECINKQLVAKGILKERRFDHRVRYVFWALFALFALLSGYLVFETLNPVGIMSRMIVYGWSLAAVWVVAVLLMEIFYSRRAWCTYICPIGTTYGSLGWGSALRMKWDNDKCTHCTACMRVCPEPHVLDFAKKEHDAARKEKGIVTEHVISGDCTLCGRCIDVCGDDAISYEFRLKDFL